jgi:dipeptidyl aminopeptidase/acylaminoacyl peptidase
MTDPQWSPCGDKLLYEVLYATNDGGECRFHDIPSSLYVMSADGKKRSRVGASKWYAISSVTWSPDGRKIAYVACDDVEDEGCVLFVVDADGRHRHKVLKQLTSTASIAWVATNGILLLDQKLQTFNPSNPRKLTVARGFDVFDETEFIGFSRSRDQVATVGYYLDRNAGHGSAVVRPSHPDRAGPPRRTESGHLHDRRLFAVDAVRPRKGLRSRSSPRRGATPCPGGALARSSGSDGVALLRARIRFSPTSD